MHDSLTYPVAGDRGVRRLAVGGLLTALGVLFVPLVLVPGYSMRVIRAVVDGDPEPPAWTDWVGPLVDGLKALVVGVVYAGVPALLVGLAVAAFFLPLAEPPTPLVSAVATVVALAAPVVALIGFYAAPAALASLADAGRLGAAFSVRGVWSVVRSGDYALAWLLALVVGLVVAVLTGSIAVLAGGAAAPGIALAVATLAIAVANFYATVVASFLYARGFAAARPVEPPVDADGGVRAPVA